MLFKTLSDEAEAEREVKRIIRDARQRIARDRANARAAYWQKQAPDIARRLGEQEAQAEIDAMTIKLNPLRTMAQTVDASPSLVDAANPTTANTQTPRS
jgi:F0F1-type ATP synthase membrane subunit b/b'